MPWNLDRAAAAATLSLEAQVDIFEAAALHQALIGLADAPGAVTVDLSVCADIDGSAVQLLLAFTRARAEGGRAVTFAIGDGAPARLLRRLQLERALACPGG